MAMAPNKNSGLEALEKATSLSASYREICSVSRSRAVIFAPAGNPLAIPTIQAKLPTPGTLNNGRMRGSNKTPINWTTPKLINNSAIIKNGSNEGNTTSHQACRPLMLANNDCSGYIMSAVVIIIKKKNKDKEWKIDRNNITPSNGQRLLMVS